METNSCIWGVRVSGKNIAHAIPPLIGPRTADTDPLLSPTAVCEREREKAFGGASASLLQAGQPGRSVTLVHKVVVRPVADFQVRIDLHAQYPTIPAADARVWPSCTSLLLDP